jgi:hypothetical protein
MAPDFGNMCNMFDPDDFHTVSVLDGAVVSVLYGPRGPRGPCVIPTYIAVGATGFGVSVSQSFGIDLAYGGLLGLMIFRPRGCSWSVSCRAVTR